MAINLEALAGKLFINNKEVLTKDSVEEGIGWIRLPDGTQICFGIEALSFDLTHDNIFGTTSGSIHRGKNNNLIIFKNILIFKKIFFIKNIKRNSRGYKSISQISKIGPPHSIENP